MSEIRREYGQLKLGEEEIDSSPIVQFKRWFDEVLANKVDDPTAMVLSTIDEHGHPDSRVVLLKEIQHESFIFYTNYSSTKGQHILNNAHVALNFYWPSLVRQVRIRGVAEPTSAETSDAYFASRPIASQWSAILSPQSKIIDSLSELEQQLQQRLTQHQTEDSLIQRPVHWGGYSVEPTQIEFWQGRDSRLHDRICYTRDQQHWIQQRLAP